MKAKILRITDMKLHTVPCLYGNMPWWRKDNAGSVLFRCPSDHLSRFLSSGVTKGGRVVAKFRCSDKGCDFHKRLRLEDWR